MFEQYLADALNKALGAYCDGIDGEKLRVSAWNGDVELRNVRLKKTALSTLRAPVTVDAGCVGSLRLKVPWMNLGREPVVVEIDRVFVLASRVTMEEAAATADETRDEEEDAAEKKKRIDEGERDWLRTAMGKMTKTMREEAERSDSWFWKTLNTVLGNLQITVQNVHVRYEDEITTPGHTFSCGMTIGKLSAITVDDFGEPTFVAGGSLERIHKRVALENFSMYLDSGAVYRPWKTHAGWTPPKVEDTEAWWALFGVGLVGEAPSDVRNYMLYPVTVELFYHRKGRKEQTEAGEPRQMCDLKFQDARMALSRNQYRSTVRLLEAFNQYRLRLPHAEFRPMVSVKAQPRAWWTYAKCAVSARKKNVLGTFEWRNIQETGALRREYLSIYIAEGSASNAEFINRVHEIERNIDFEVALAWRCIAHSKSKAASTDGRPPSLASKARGDVILMLKEEESEKSGYFSWMWQSSTELTAKSLEMSNDDWSKLEELMRGGVEEEDFDPKELGMEFRGSMKKLSMELTDHDDHNKERLVLNSSMIGAKILTKTYKDQSNTYFTINSWTCETTNDRILSSGVGASLRKHALEVKHNAYPLEHDLDANVDVKLSPVYIVFDGQTVDQLRNFFSSKELVQTNFALQVDEAMIKLEEAKESTTEALNKVAMTFDIHAPKVTIPVRRRGRVAFQTLVDFGHFTMVADPLDPSVSFDRKTGAPVYQTFAVASRDTAVFLAPSDFDWGNSVSTSLDQVCETLLAPCDAKMRFAMQGAGWTPEVGPRSKVQISLSAFQMYMSPSKMARVYATMQMTSSAKQSSMALSEDAGSTAAIDAKPWSDALISGAASAKKVGLVGGASGYHSRWLCIQGPYLYILEKPDAAGYIDFVRIGYSVRVTVLEDEEDGEKQNLILAIHDSKTPKSRARDTNNTWLFRFADEQEHSKWQRWLQDMNEVAVATRAVQSSTKAIVEEETSENLNRDFDEEDVVDSVLTMELGSVSVHLSGQPMGIPGAKCDGLENGGVARLLDRNLAESTEIPVAELSSTSALISVQTKEHSREFVMEVSSMDIVDKLCGTTETMRLMSAHARDDVKVRLKYKELSESSPEYNNISTTMCLDTENISFALHRPTIGSLYRMQEEIKVILAAFSSTDTEAITKVASFGGLIDEDSDRISFQMLLHFHSTVIMAYLEKEEEASSLQPLFDCCMDDLQLEMNSKAAVQEVSMSLGNLRVGDQTAPKDNAYRQFIDLNSSDASNTSRTQIDVFMYNHLASNFPGYEYDVRVKFHDVKMIVMYAFIQKLMGYTSMFTPPPLPVSALPESERNAELLRRGDPRPFTMIYAVEMERPELIFPRSSTSDQAFSMDAECIRVNNKLKWEGGKSHLDVGAVLLDSTNVSFFRCSACVWDKFKKTTSMIPERDMALDVYVRSPKWDPKSRSPSYEIVVDFLNETKVEMSDFEYRVLTALSVENFAEVVPVPQPLYQIAEIVSVESGNLNDKFGAPYMLMSMNVNKMRMVTFASAKPKRNKPLAAFQIDNMHVGYRKDKDGEMSVSVICPDLALNDLRVGIPTRAQQVFGSSHGSTSTKTLFRVDAKQSSTSYDCDVFFQDCRMMYDPQFGLAIYNFFSNTSEDESESGLVNARLRQDLNFGTRASLTLEEDFDLSSSTRILCNAPEGAKEVELNGNGRELVFHVSNTPLIYIAAARHLKLTNVRIIIPIGSELSDFVQLEADSQLSAEEVDGVVIVHENRAKSRRGSENSLATAGTSSFDYNVKASMPGVELIFLDTSSGAADYVLRMRTDAEFQYTSAESKQDAAFAFTQFQVAVSEWSSKGNMFDSSIVLRPIDIDGRMQATADDMEMMMRATDADFVLDAQSIERLTSLSKGFTATLQSTGLYNQTVSCSTFVRVGGGEGGAFFWRPVPPPGFTLLGDCVTLDETPPTRPVVVITDADGLTKAPVEFHRMCAFEGETQKSVVWRPIPPDGYCSLGCVVTSDEEPPPLDVMRCMRAEVVNEAYYSACISHKTSSAYLRQVKNGPRTFQAFADGFDPMTAADLSSPLLPEPFPLIADAEQILEDNISMDSTDMLQTVTTYDFKILWSDEKPEGSRQASIWRPRPPQGYVSLGDCLIAGPEPPTAGVLAVAEDSDIIASPIGFVLVGSIRQGDSGTHAVWRPINPQGYVSCGDVVTNDTKNPPQLTTCACLRQDLAIEVSRKGICTDPTQLAHDAIFVQDALWSAHSSHCQLWSSDPDAPLDQLPRWGLFHFSKLDKAIAPRQFRPRQSVLDYVRARANKSKGKDPNVSLKMSMPRVSLVLLEREAFSYPLICATLSDTAFVVNGTSTRMDGNTMFNVAVSSYNSSRNVWEPVIDATNSYLKFSYSDTGDESAPAGTAVQVKTVTPLCMTVSQRFVASMLRWSEWQDQTTMVASGVSELRAADEDSIRYDNHLVNQDVYLRVGSSEAVCLKPGESREIRTANRHVESYALPIDDTSSPLTSSQNSEKMPVRAKWSANIHLISADVPTDDEMSQIVASMIFEFPDGLGSTKVTTRAITSNSQNSRINWNEEFQIIPRVTRASKTHWREYAKDVLVTLVIADDHNIESSENGVATKSMTLASFFSNLTVSGERSHIGEGVIKVPLVDDDGSLEVKVRVQFVELDSKREHASNDDSNQGDSEVCIAFAPHGPWKSIDARMPNAAQIIDGKSSRCIAKSSGPSVCTFKPMATFINTTSNDIEVCICPAGMHPDDKPGRASTKKRPKRIYEEVFENQRRIPLAGFSSKHLIPTERKAWSNGQGANSTNSIDEFTTRLLPADFKWDGQWEVHVGENTDSEGWAYAINLPDLKYPFSDNRQQGPLSMVRMRRWVRRRVPIEENRPVVLDAEDDAALRQSVVVKPNETVGLIPAIIGPDARAELFVRNITLRGQSSWGANVDDHGSTWSCMIHSAMEGAEIACTTDAEGKNRFIGIQVEADAVTPDCKAADDGTGFEDCELLEDGYYNLNPEAMEWKITAGAPHIITNHSPHTMTLTVFQGQVDTPLSVKAISTATITPWNSLPIHSVHPETPYYLRLALDDGFEVMVPPRRLIPVSPMAVEALASAGTLDAFDAFEMPLTDAVKTDDDATSLDEVNLRSSDGRTAVLDARTDFGFLSRSARKTVFSASLIIVNKSGVNLAIRTSTMEIPSTDEDSSISKVKMVETYAPKSKRGIQSLHHCAIRKAPKENQVIMLEVGIDNSNAHVHLSPGIPIDERELLRGAVVVRALCKDGSFYSLTVRMETGSEYSKEGAQVVFIEPRCTVTNQTGMDILLAQSSDDKDASALILKATDITVPLKMQTANDDGLVRIKLPHAKWSAPIDLYGIKTIKDSMKIPIRSSVNPEEFDLLSLHLDTSKLGVSKVSCAIEPRFTANILIENASDVDFVAFRQACAIEDNLEAWIVVPPQSAKAFAWSRPRDTRKLAVRVLQKGSFQSSIQRVYDFDHLDLGTENEMLPGLPVPKIELKTTAELDIDGGDSVYFNFLPVTRRLRRGRRIVRIKSYGSSTVSKHLVSASRASSTESRISVLITESSLAIVDGAMSEIINCTTSGVGFEYLSGVGGGIERMALTVKSLQVDDMNDGSQYPVVVRLLGDTREHSFLTVKVVTKTSAGLEMRIYPFIDVTFAPLDVQLAVHEPLIWRLVNFSEVMNTTSSKDGGERLEVVNLPIAIGSFHVSELKLRLRFRSALYSRPKHAMPAFMAGMAFVNIDDGQLYLHALRVRRVRTLEQAFMRMISDSYSRQVARQALLLLVGVDVLDSFSQALSQASAGVAALSLDKKFSHSMNATLGPDAQKADSIKNGLASGTEMLAKGVFRGFTGVFRKPIEGAAKGGALGFVKGVGKGLVGAVAQPIAGGLAAVGRTAEGIASGVDGVKSALGVNSSAPQHRIREPRAQHADGILRTYDANAARSQRALRTAERGKLGGGIDEVFTHKGYYGRDKYLGSVEVNSRAYLIVLTDQRVVTLKRTAADKYVALWHVGWHELLHVEVQAPANCVLHLKEYSRKKRLFEKQRITRVIKTTPGTNQPEELTAMIADEMTRRSNSKFDEDEYDDDGEPLPPYMPCVNWKCVVSRGQTCFWAPIPPVDKYIAFGHVIGGTNPPSEPVSMVLRSGGNSVVLSPPVRFELIYREQSDFTVWMPVAPARFRALGAVVVKGVEPPKNDLVTCVRTDFLTLAPFDDDASWMPEVDETMRRSDRKHFENASMWSIDNLGRTFIATRSRDCPDGRFALDVLDAHGDDDRAMI